MTNVTTTQDHKRPKERRISKRVRHACGLLVTGRCTTVSAAAEQAKLSREHLSRSLQMPHVRMFIESETRKTIAAAQMRAGSRLAHLMDSAKSEHVQKEIATWLCELSGYVVAKNAAPAVHIHNNVAVCPGYVLDLSPTPRTIEGDVVG